MNRKKIFTKKKGTGIAALLVALAIIITGTFAWKDFSQSAISLFSADAASKHWVSLVDDFQSATNVATNTLVGWKRGNVSDKQVYISSKLTNTKANPTGVVADPEDVYDPVYVRVMLTQELTIGGGDPIIDPKADSNSINQYPTYVKWNDNATIKTIDKWVEEESKQGAYWILDNTTGWLYWAQPLEFGEETAHLLDTVELLIEPEKALEYTVDVTLQAVSSDLDSTTGTGDYLGGFEDWGIASTAEILPLFIEPFVFTIDTRLGTPTNTYALNVNANEDNDFAVDWGDGTPRDARTNTNRGTAHTYAVDGQYTIKIIGTMPSAMRFYNEKRLTSVQSGFLENTASDMANYFYNCTNLKTIPGSLFEKSAAVTTFAYTFHSCSSLTSIPAGLFAAAGANVTTFAFTFYGCSRLTSSIPADLFKTNTAVTTFASTFTNCSDLTGSIPEDLFKTNTAVINFETTFASCSSLTGSIPEDLFEYNPAVTTFKNTFVHCRNLEGEIPADLFKTNPVVTTFSGTFYGCGSLTSIPTGLFDNNPAVTNFNITFNGCTSITSALPTLWDLIHQQLVLTHSRVVRMLQTMQ